MKRTYIVVSDKCNKNCTFCYERDKNILEVTENLSIIPDSDQYVLIGGEPLLFKDKIKTMINYLKNKEIIVTTNGTLLTQTEINEVKDTNVYYQVSIYDKSVYNKLINMKLNDNIIIHLLIDDNYDTDLIINVLLNLNKNLWISFDRFMKNKNTINFVLKLIDLGYIKKSYLRTGVKAGKICYALNDNEQCIINGNKVYKNTCMLHITNLSKVTINDKCSECKTLYCDACVCDIKDIDRNIMCELFKSIERKFEKC